MLRSTVKKRPTQRPSKHTLKTTPSTKSVSKKPTPALKKTIKRTLASKPQVDISSLPQEVQDYVNFPTKPHGMLGTVENNFIFNLAATINAPTNADSWTYNLGSGVHPAAIWAIAPFSLPTKDLSPDGYHDPCLPKPPTPFVARMWGSGEISWKSPIFIGSNVLQVASVESKPQFKRGKQGDFLISTYTNRWCNADQPQQVAVEEKVNYIFRDPKNKLKEHVRDNNIKQPVYGEGYDFERPHLDLNEAVLFRYSAVTWNTHRIHYDRDYAKGEGYKDILVHGPLQATLALDLLGAVSEAICPEEPALSKHVYHALNVFHRQNEKKQLLEQHSHSHSHSHSHGGQPCGHDHGNTPEINESDISNLPAVPWHTRFQSLRHFAYELKQPLYVNTPVRVLAKVVSDEFNVDEYERQLFVASENRKAGQPAKSFTMRELLRNQPAYVRVWIQDANDPSLIYFNSTACFDAPAFVHYDQVPEKGLNMLLQDLQEKLPQH